MLYRPRRHRHTTYRHERQLWPLPFDRYLVSAIALSCWPRRSCSTASMSFAYLLPWIIWSVAALGLQFADGGAGTDPFSATAP